MAQRFKLKLGISGFLLPALLAATSVGVWLYASQRMQVEIAHCVDRFKPFTSSMTT